MQQEPQVGPLRQRSGGLGRRVSKRTSAACIYLVNFLGLLVGGRNVELKFLYNISELPFGPWYGSDEFPPLSAWFRCVAGFAAGGGQRPLDAAGCVVKGYLEEPLLYSVGRFPPNACQEGQVGRWG